MLRSIVTTLALMMTVAASPAPEPASGTITGRVLGTDTRDGIAYVSIFIMDARLGGPTDRDGRFSISHVPLGAHEIRLKMIGYLPLTRRISVHPGQQSLGTLWLKPVVSPIHIVGTLAKPNNGGISCEVILVNDKVYVDDQLQLKLVVRNNGRSDVVLPYGVAGSDGIRYPWIRVTVNGPDHGFSTDGRMACCPEDAIAESDYKTVDPGGVVDVFSKGWLPSDLRVGRFKKPGAYTAIVSYSTRQTNAQYWIGTTSYSEVSSEIVKRLRKIPLVDLVDSVSFEVHERTR